MTHNDRAVLRHTRDRSLRIPAKVTGEKIEGFNFLTLISFRTSFKTQSTVELFCSSFSSSREFVSRTSISADHADRSDIDEVEELSSITSEHLLFSSLDSSIRVIIGRVHRDTNGMIRKVVMSPTVRWFSMSFSKSWQRLLWNIVFNSSMTIKYLTIEHWCHRHCRCEKHWLCFAFSCASGYFSTLSCISLVNYFLFIRLFFYLLKMIRWNSCSFIVRIGSFTHKQIHLSCYSSHTCPYWSGPFNANLLSTIQERNKYRLTSSGSEK